MLTKHFINLSPINFCFLIMLAPVAKADANAQAEAAIRYYEQQFKSMTDFLTKQELHATVKCYVKSDKKFASIFKDCSTQRIDVVTALHAKAYMGHDRYDFKAKQKLETDSCFNKLKNADTNAILLCTKQTLGPSLVKETDHISKSWEDIDDRVEKALVSQVQAAASSNRRYRQPEKKLREIARCFLENSEEYQRHRKNCDSAQLVSNIADALGQSTTTERTLNRWKVGAPDCYELVCRTLYLCSQLDQLSLTTSGSRTADECFKDPTGLSAARKNKTQRDETAYKEKVCPNRITIAGQLTVIQKLSPSSYLASGIETNTGTGGIEHAGKYYTRAIVSANANDGFDASMPFKAYRSVIGDFKIAGVEEYVQKDGFKAIALKLTECPKLGH